MCGKVGIGGVGVCFLCDSLGGFEGVKMCYVWDSLVWVCGIVCVL